jgi:GntR family transcriptional regulator/MocR family aminotransferase
VESLGATHLRTAIAEYLAFSRGVLCDPEQIVVTAGAHNAIDLIARVVFDPGDEVWCEDPGYVAARATLVMNGAKVRPIPVDQEGLRVEDGLRLSPQARAAFVTPSHQYPLGVEMTKARRIQLLDWAEAHDAWIVENDFGSDFRYAGSPAPTLYRIGRENGDRVIYVGTFSNVLAPGLRLGFLVAPNELIEPIRRVRIFSDRQPPEPLQSQLAEFIAQGFLADHLRRMNSIYQDRRDAVFEALQDRSSCSLDPGHKPNTGMHLVARLPRHDDALVSRKALAIGINVPALSGFFADPANGLRGLVIGFAGTPAMRAKRAATALRSVIDRTDTIDLI